MLRIHRYLGRQLDFYSVRLADLLLPIGNKLLKQGLAKPPAAFQFIGGGDFDAIGQEFKAHFVELGGLTPEMDVLDIGSGLGRMALPLTTFLASDRTYIGLEVVRSAVQWCDRRITPLFPNFRFLHADVFNSQYNPRGRIQPESYVFPIAPASTDFAFMTSVLTHMLPRSTENYAAQLARVVRPGGRLFTTAFLLNEQSIALIAEGRSRISFGTAIDGQHAHIDDRMPERAVAYAEAYLVRTFREHGFDLVGAPAYGSWCGRAHGSSFQDILVLARQ